MINLIVAIGQNNLIGKDNDLPWNYKEDLKYFKENTLNKDVLMGYNTYLSIYSRIGKALPKRNNFVLHFNNDIETPGASVTTDLLSFLENYKNNEKELFVIGGASVYKQTLEHADRLYITLINKSYEGNVYFPEVDLSNFKLIKKTDVDLEIEKELSFLVYERIK